MSDYLAYTSGVVRLFATLDDANAWLAEVGGGKMFVAVERLAAAEAFVAKHKCQTCGGVRVREAELCCCDEAAKGWRDE